MGLPIESVSPVFHDVAGVKTYFLQGGAGEPVVFLHGMGESSYCWRHLLAPLAKTHAVFAPDFPGYGRSDKPWNFDYTFIGLARWLGRFIEAMNLPRAALVGSSMGGAVALCLAVEQPQLVSRLVLIGAPVYLTNVPLLVRIARRPVVRRLLEPILGRWIVRAVAPTAFHNLARITEDMIEEYSLALQSRAGRHAISESIRRCISPNLADIVSHYPKLEPPALFIRGEYDGVVDDASAKKFCSTVPGGKFLHIPACGHVPQEENPGAIIPAIAEFLSSPKKPATA